MKKTLLFGLSFMLFAGANAQQRAVKKIGSPLSSEQFNKREYVSVHNHFNHPKTRATSRWYNQAEATSAVAGVNLFDAAHVHLNYLWQDSTMLANFGGTQDHIWVKSISQVLDPKSSIFNNSATFPGEMEINKSSGVFSVDSVGITCIYTRVPAKASIVDTLIVTISKGNSTPSDLLFWPETQAVVVSDYSVDTIFIADPNYDFSSFTMKKTAGSIAYTKKYLLNAASANDTTSTGWNYFSFPVTGLTGLTAASLPVMTVTFKSGDTWIANVDSIGSNYNFFDFVSSRENAPAGFRSYTKKDYNMSSLIENDTTGWGIFYIPSFYFNSPSYEFHWFDWKLSCATCLPTSIENVSTNSGINVSVTPNPASKNAKLSINLTESAKNVSITFTNAIGQEVKTLNLGSMNANVNHTSTLNVSDLATGLYIYTVNADGQKISNKLMIK